jgi:hypothetical protein
MKKTTLIFVTLLLLLSCEKHDKACGFNDPLEDLAWLRNVKISLGDCTCEISIIQALYNKQTIFYTALTDPLCDGYYPYVLRNCAGDPLKTYLPDDPAFSTDVTDRNVIYRCSKNK